MRVWFGGALFALAIVLTVALTPASRWIFQNQLDLMDRAPIGDFLPAPLAYFVPDWVGSPSTYSSNDLPQQLMKALCLRGPERLAAVAQFTRQHPEDAAGRAVLVRMCCMIGSHFPDDPTAFHGQLDPYADAALRDGLEACAAGQTLEPGNAYFPLMRAAFAGNLSHTDEMRAALDAAGRASVFNNHLIQQELTCSQAIVHAKGYRGEVVRLGLEESILLPDYAVIKALARYLHRTGTLPEKGEMLHAMDLMISNEPAGIGILVANSSSKILLSPAGFVDQTSGQSLPDETWRTWALQFDAKNGSKSALDLTNREIRLLSATKAYFKRSNVFSDLVPSESDDAELPDTGFPWIFIHIVLPYIALTALWFAVVFSAIGSALVAWSPDWLSRAKPYLVLGVSVVAAVIVVGKANPYVPVLDSLLIASAIAVPLCVLAFAFPGKPLSDRRKAVADWSAGIGMAVLALAAGVIAVCFGLGGHLWASLPITLSLAGLSGLVCLGRTPRAMAVIGCTSMTVFSSLYLVSAGIQVRDDHREILAQASFLDEGNRIRALADHGE
jgi:hypothetical protein